MYATRSPPGAAGALRGAARDRRAARPPLHGRRARLRGRGPRRLQRLHARPGDRPRRARQPRLLRRPPNDLRCPWHYRHVRCSPAIDYSRFRELRVGIYTFLCVSISLVFVFGFAARGSRRSFELPFFSFQPSELGKLLLVLALAGFVIDGARRGSARQRTVRYLCLGLAPAALVFLQPDLGTALVFGAITLAVMYVGGVPWTHFAAIGAALVALIALVLVVGARSRDADPQGVPAREADLLPASQRGPQRRGLPAEPGQDRHRLRGDDRPWRPGHPDAARLRPRAAHRLHLRGDR